MHKRLILLFIAAVAGIAGFRAAAQIVSFDGRPMDADSVRLISEETLGGQLLF